MTQGAPDSSEFLVKLNLIVIDGRDLNCCRTLEWDPYSEESQKYVQNVLTPTSLNDKQDSDSKPSLDRSEILYSSFIQEIICYAFQARQSTLELYQQVKSEYGGSTEKHRRQGMFIHHPATETVLRPIEMVFNPQVDVPSSIRSSFSAYNYEPFPINKSIWYVVKEKYKFQTESMYNQVEDVLTSLLSLAIRESIDNKPGDPIGCDTIYSILDDYHSRLFNNYVKWCDYLGEKPFPWQHPPWLEEDSMLLAVRQAIADAGIAADPESSQHRDINAAIDSNMEKAMRDDLQQMMYEIALFKLLWGEGANMRHTPELLCWLFHWMVMAWSPHVSQEETYLDVIKDVVQRMRDEQWRLDGSLKAPDHCGRLLYDDINEVFWETACVSALHRNQRKGAEAKAKPKKQVGNIATTREDEQSLEGATEDNLEAKDRLKEDVAGILVTGDNFRKFLGEFLHGDRAGKGIKTFVERRSYLHVIRTFWRIFSIHAISFQLMLLIRSWIDDDQIGVDRFWFRAIMSAAWVQGLQPILDMCLVDIKVVRKKHFWQTFLQKNLINFARLALLAAVIWAVVTDGWDTQLLGWNGPVGGALCLFYLAHSAWPFLFIRIFGRMPFFTLLWRLPFVNYLTKPATYTGSIPLLAEDFLKMLHYVVFWIPVIALKCLFWIYGIFPQVVTASEYIPLVTWRPYYMLGFAVVVDPEKVLLKIALWLPVFLLWLFDLQIFFLIIGAIYGSLVGYYRRVGYFKDTRMIQKRVIPMLPSVPIFGISAKKQIVHYEEQQVPFSPADTVYMTTASPSKFTLRATSPSASATGTLYSQMERDTGLQPSCTAPIPKSPVSSRKVAAKYANNSDPYTQMLPSLTSASLSHTVSLAGQIDEDSKQRKRFGFLWNEIVRSWRLEDIINNEEYHKMQFNEMPRIIKMQGAWRALRDGGGKCAVLWERSSVRLPVYIYCDVLTTFLKKCDNFQTQMNDDMARFRSKANIARDFYTHNISDDPRHQDPRFQNSLHIEAMREIAEALALYLARYCDDGVKLVQSGEDLWQWIKEDGSRLIWINLHVLKELRPTLQALFQLLQRVATFNSSEEAKLKQNIEKLKKSLIGLIKKRDSAKPVPEVIQDFLSAIDYCFDGMRTTRLPPVAAPGVPTNELQEVVNDLLCESNERRKLGEESGEKERLPQPHYGSIPCTIQRIASIRAILKLHSMAYLQHTIREQKMDGGGHTHVWVVEHSLRMYFRRVARILQATNPSLQTTEATRRY